MQASRLFSHRLVGTHKIRTMSGKRKERSIMSFFKPVNASMGDKAPGQTPKSEEPLAKKIRDENVEPIAAAVTKNEEVRVENAVPVTGYASLLKDEQWRGILSGEFKKPYWAKLETFLEQEQRANPGKIFPAKEHVFRAFDSCAMEDIKVVVMGQDPYHDVGQAMGLCFSVPKGIKVPSSLLNIYKELNSDLGCKVPTHGDLDKWAKQGVLLLNASLTVRAHAANSHSKKGWETFTDAAIREVSKKRTGLVFLLWGKNAQDKEKLISKTNGHVVLKCPHPSGLSAHRGFFGSKHFSQCNDALVSNGRTPIDWQIEGPYRLLPPPQN